jgi:hypothetical protein
LVWLFQGKILPGGKAPTDSTEVLQNFWGLGNVEDENERFLRKYVHVFRHYYSAYKY